MDPAMANAAVRKNPPGPLPGASSLASYPTTSPIRIVQMICTSAPSCSMLRRLALRILVAFRTARA